jgi:hypothetical protein
MRFVFYWIILLSIPVMFALLSLTGYFSYRKLTYPGYSCGSFAQIDDELGWVLKPNADSCIGAREAFGGGPPWFEASVFTDKNGFRSASSGGETRTGGIMAVGDSWTFGFGVPYEQSYPAQLAALSGIPTATIASPAYSTAQSLLLAERWARQLKPRVIVFLDHGSWERAACGGASRPRAILKPCYWQAPGAQSAELVLPPPQRVSHWADWGVLPGGVLGAGEISWAYFLITRPAALVQQTLVRMNLASGFGDDFRAVGVNDEVIKKATLFHAARLAEMAKAPLLLLDPGEIYHPYLSQLPAALGDRIHHIGSTEWKSQVENRTAGMKPEEISVPNDGHYGAGVNRLVAELINSWLRMQNP